MENIRTKGLYTSSLNAAEGLKHLLKEKGLLLRKTTETINMTKIATLDQEGKIKVWSTETGALLATLSGTYLDDEHMPLIQFSETGNSLVVTDQDFVKTLYFSPDETTPSAEVKRPIK
ncbi:hypothetical protein H0W26_04115 [Candidatus Dependentiae bacterium]|nr:hypothetical protein [Candidatus Dependentiae bacterium]